LVRRFVDQQVETKAELFAMSHEARFDERLGVYQIADAAIANVEQPRRLVQLAKYVVGITPLKLTNQQTRGLADFHPKRCSWWLVDRSTVIFDDVTYGRHGYQHSEEADSAYQTCWRADIRSDSQKILVFCLLTSPNTK
jgi:hypothetical protein